MKEDAVSEPRQTDVLQERWYHVGPPWSATPGLIYAGSEDPHAGTYILDCGDWDDELHFGERQAVDVRSLADLIVDNHNAAMADQSRPAPADRRVTCPEHPGGCYESEHILDPLLAAPADRSAEEALQTHSAEYNRGWADGNASALDACNPLIEKLQAALSSTEAGPERFDRSWWHYADDCPVPPSTEAGRLHVDAYGVVDEPHTPTPSDICSSCGRGLVHVVPSLDPTEAGRLREALATANEAAFIIEVADNRAAAADGPVSHVRDEMSDREWSKLYAAVKKTRDALRAALESETEQ